MHSCFLSFKKNGIPLNKLFRSGMVGPLDCSEVYPGSGKARKAKSIKTMDRLFDSSLFNCYCKQ